MGKNIVLLFLLISSYALNAQTERNAFYFGTDNDTEGWGSGSATVTTTNGKLKLNFDQNHNQPWAISDGTFYVNAGANKYLHITIKNNSPEATQFRLKFTDASNNKKTVKAKKLSNSSAGFVTYDFNIDDASFPTWTGNIDKIILLFRNKANTNLNLTGNIEITSILCDNNPSLLANNEETIFSDYFDIKTNSSGGTPVIGKIHLKSNKDVLTTPIPIGYEFELISDPSGLFTLISKRENIDKMHGLLIGELLVKSGFTTPTTPIDHTLTIALKSGGTTVLTKNITVNVVNKTMQKSFIDYYKPKTISESHMYGRKTLTDSEIQDFITEINLNDGQLKSINDVFNLPPEQISGLRDQWYEVIRHIGAFGYAYQDTSSSYYESSTLKNAIYKSARAYMNNLPVFGDDIANPLGMEIGDGFQDLYENGQYLEHSDVTHPWVVVDALAAPLVHISEEMATDITTGDSDAIKLQESIYRFYQLFNSVVVHRRTMDSPGGRWGDISSPYSNGAWSDANIGHRMRSLMAMTIVWNDYNRPLTYVPYWYDDYFNGTPFEGKLFAKDWTPRGIVNDLNHWFSKFSDESYLYNQSGFHPDGTVTHHKNNGASDVALFSYGFGWITNIIGAIEYFKETTIPIEDKSYQFLANRLDYTYRNIIYKQRFDYVVSGRAYYADMKKFATRDVKNAIDDLIAGMSSATTITNKSSLTSLSDNISNNTHTHSGSIPFWNADFLVHRKENQEENFYFSVKQKSSRTLGAEDFASVKKSWHAGSGVFQLKVDGTEYQESVRKEYDWHLLPGITEEWRTDLIPGRPGPSLSDFSGILTDGTYATSAFVYDPPPTVSTINQLDEIAQYSSASAYKSYHLIGNTGTALGSNIARKDPGQGEPIVTCVDQSKFDANIYYSINNGSTVSLPSGSSNNLTVTMDGPTWLFHENKGYLIFPNNNDQKLHIKSGTHINVTDPNTTTSSNYIIAIDHGTNPTSGNYHYVMLGDVLKDNMPNLLTSYQNENKIVVNNGISHAVHDTINHVVESTFFQASTIYLNDDNTDWIKTNKPALIIREELEDDFKLSVVDALHDLTSQSIEIEIPQALQPGVYSYNFNGLSVVPGESATVALTSTGSKVTINLPDNSDDIKYSYKQALFAGAPITINIPKSSGSLSNLSIENYSSSTKKGLLVYPQPITQETIITTNSKNKIYQLECFNILGELLYRKSYNSPEEYVKLNNKTLSASKAQTLLIKVYTKNNVFSKIVIVGQD